MDAVLTTLALAALAALILVVGAAHFMRRPRVLHAACVYAEEPGGIRELWNGTYPSKLKARRAARANVRRFDSLGDVYGQFPVRWRVSQIKR